MRIVARRCSVLVVLALAPGWVPAQEGSDTRFRLPRTKAELARPPQLPPGLPFYFEANHGQADSRIRFLARAHGHTLLVTPTEAVLELATATGSASSHAGNHVGQEDTARRRRLRMTLVGAGPEAPVLGRDPLPGRVHYLRGQDPRGWRTNVPTYRRVDVREVYPAIDLTYYGSGSHLEFDFVVKPGGDPAAIRLAFGGADRLDIDARGDLVLRVGDGELRLPRPHIYQERDGNRRTVLGGYIRHAGGEVGFDVGTYDPGVPLVIDPVLTYSTYLGGSRDEQGAGIAVDLSGNAYIAGTTDSSDFLQRTGENSRDVFVAKFDAAGALVYATYFGGSGGDRASAIAVDATGHAYVTGSTHSSDFPTVNASQPALAGDDDAFVAKLDASGAELVYSTYLGGGDEDGAADLALDAAGAAYVTGYTYSRDFPTASAVQPEFAGGLTDGFVAKLAGSGSTLAYSTYLGGRDRDHARGIAVDNLGQAYVTGGTASTDFPTAVARQAALAGPSDAFLVKLHPAGSAFAYSTFLGGGETDEGTDVVVDGPGNAYVAGITTSTDFPTATPLQAAAGGGADAFVAQLNGAGSTLLYSTRLGGSEDEAGPAIALGAAGDIFVAGSTESSDFPTANPVQAAYGGRTDLFVVRIGAGGAALAYATYLGASGADEARGIAVDTEGAAYIIGRTTSGNFPTASSVQPSLGGRSDAVVVKLRP